MTDRRRARSGSPFETSIGFSRAVRVGDRIEVSGTAPIWPDGSCPEDPAAQAERCFEIALDAVEELGGSVADVVRTRLFLTNRSDAGAIGEVHGRLFGEVHPAATMVVVAGLLDPRWRVEVEVTAVVAAIET